MNKHLARLIMGCGVVSVPLILAGNFWHVNILAYVGIGLLGMFPILGVLERFTPYHVLPGYSELTNQ